MGEVDRPARPDSSSPPPGCATLAGSEALRARQATWRAVFDSPRAAVRFLLSRLPDGSCAVSDQTSSGSAAASEPDAAKSAEALSAVAELQHLLLATEDITGFLEQLATLTVKVFPVEVSCGITLRRDRGVFTVASSDDRAS